MKKILLFFLLGITYLTGFTQAPVNDNCSGAIEIVDVTDFCSSTGQYTNVNATEQFIGDGREVWFKFRARAFEVKITVTGATLSSPLIKLYRNCAGSGLIGSSIKDGNKTIFTKGGLTPSNTSDVFYYISVSGESNSTGTFQICINNYNPTVQPGQDFAGSAILCSVTDTVREVNVTGAGSTNQEARGTCLNFGESNSAWYRWTALNSGTLAFTIKPEKRDDIDWVLFDLGPEENIQPPSASNAIRCAAGHGISNTDCPRDPQYVLTGLDFNESDLREESGCGGGGQNGVVKFIEMQQGHNYALLVDNFSQGNNGFEITFTDRNGKAGTGQFVGPTAKVSSVKNNECTPLQSYTFTGTATGYTGLKWYFGDGASIDSADTPGIFNITYSTPGLKTVLLQAKNSEGCSVVETQTFMVGLKADKPAITANKPDFCIQDTIRLSTPELEDGVYHWTGPNNFSSTEREVNIPVKDFSVSGTYRLTTEIFGCMSEETTINIPPVLKNPTAAFSTSPAIVAKFSAPLKVTFTNESTDADTYLWDFGDGTTSSEINPVHEYTLRGDYNITLTAFKSDVCQTSVVKGTFIVRPAGSLFVPNTFTPNADGINDEFVVTLINLNAYHIRIFNRWGEQLFEANEIFTNWKGTYKGDPVPVGTYFYIIDAIDTDNVPVKRSGSVTVLR